MVRRCGGIAGEDCIALGHLRSDPCRRRGNVCPILRKSYAHLRILKCPNSRVLPTRHDVGTDCQAGVDGGNPRDSKRGLEEVERIADLDAAGHEAIEKTVEIAKSRCSSHPPIAAKSRTDQKFLGNVHAHIRRGAFPAIKVGGRGRWNGATTLIRRRQIGGIHIRLKVEISARAVEQ